MSVIKDVQDKTKKLQIPKNFVTIPALIHVNGVTKKVPDANYFHKIIDFSKIFNE